MQTRQQRTRTTALPSQLIEKIVTTVWGNSPIDAFNCKIFRDSVTLDTIYKIIHTNRLRFRPFSVQQYKVIRKCKKLNNPHAKYFTIVEEKSGKQLLQDAADQGQLDAIFILGMILTTEGIEREQEGLIMLNNAYVNTRRSSNLRHTCNKVQNHLLSEASFYESYGTTFMYQYSWLLNCEIYLWDACFVKFARMFDISLE
uniref:At2g35280-like TPR domain-containing protein n=1 Tax=Lactuca sativa TaxID=4236 RepID=A0A9R1USN9_LACSA|nr:hypothetical protein LSAT_V11C800440240 [Lactuca sativa]